MSETKRDDGSLEGLPPALRAAAEAHDVLTKEPAQQLRVFVDRINIKNADAGEDLSLPLTHLPEVIEVLDERGSVRAFALTTKEDMSDRSTESAFDNGRLKMYIVQEGGREVLKISYNPAGWAQ